MKILLSPIGKSDPHGKPDRQTGEDTPGSALAICAALLPDKAILLPTECADGEDTRTNAEQTKEWMLAEWPHIEVTIYPVALQEPQSYEEALRAYGTAISAVVPTDPGYEVILNASSGTPAIKFACLLAVAEGRLVATPYYVDDPTQSRRAERVYPLNVTFLRESALMQRAGDLLAQGQFGLAQQPLEELARKAFQVERRAWAQQWIVICQVLQLWDERYYSTASGRIGKLLRQWADAPSAVRNVLLDQQAALHALASSLPPNGSVAWDLFFQADRLQVQGHLTAAFAHLWIAVENAVFEYLEREYHVSTEEDDLTSAVQKLEHTHKAPAFLRLLQSKLDSDTIRAAYHNLRKIRNKAIHRGSMVTAGQLNRMRDFTQTWLTCLRGKMPAGYPLSLEELRNLAVLFTAD